MKNWVCIFLLCVFVVSCSEGSYTVSRGGAGETCQARNDCKEGLLCVRNTCIPEGLGLSPTGKQCYRVECAEKADCCADFIADTNCATYQEACETDPTQCLPFLSMCVCNESCEDSLCVARGPACVTDDHCPFVTTPFCGEASQCVECKNDGHCGETGGRCVQGSCEAPCTDDAQCDLLHGCQQGACVFTGCQTDRECAFLLGDGGATCEAGRCVISCSSSAECDASGFEVCHRGACVFAGCNTDVECRAALGVENAPEGVRATCK